MARSSLLIPFVVLAVAPLAHAAEPRIELEVATEKGFQATESRAWNELLGAMVTSVRIRGATPSDQPSIEMRGSETSPSYRVVGLLTSGNQLILPKARFKLADRDGLSRWFAKLKEGGIEGVTVKPAAFGLLPRQLVSVHEALAVPVSFSTIGKKPRDVARQISSGLSLKFIADAEATRALAFDEPVADELQGLSSGTALAAVLRPLGLVLVPEKDGNDLRLRIATSQSVKEHWPVGWPAPKNPRETLPGLFKFLNVEVEQTPLGESLTAIGKRLETSLLIDHNSLARTEVDLNAKVDLPYTNTFYDKVLDRLLIQVKLKYEIRIDEADKPFLWITTIRQE